MATISIFLRIIFQNIQFILPVAVVFLVVILVGVIIFLTFTNEKEWYLILPAGAVTGLFTFIVFLGVFSYVLKASPGISIIFGLYILLGIYLYKKRLKIPKIQLLPTINNISLTVLSFLILGFTAFLAGANQYGGDVIAYWGFATSFANGNYPIYSPWQPDYLSIHHKGTYMFEGAVHALTGANMSLVHTMYSYFVIVCGFFLIWGLVRKIIKKDYLSIIPSFAAYFSYGAIFFPLPDFLRRLFTPEVEHVTGRLPLLLDAKNRLGGASNLPEFIYINHRAAAFAGVILIIVLLFIKFKNEKLKPLIIAALSVGIISSDEIFLPVIGSIVFAWFLSLVFGKVTKNKKGILRNFFIGGMTFVLLFLTVENAVRNSLIVPSPEPRFTLLTDINSVQLRSKSLNSAILRQNDNSGYFWFLPDLRIIIAATLLFVFLSGSSELKVASAGIIGAFFAYYLIDHTYYPQNNERYLHLLYQFSGFILSFSILLSAKIHRKVLKRIYYLVIYILILPSVVFTFIYLFPLAKRADYPNYDGHLPTSQVLIWMRKNIPRERVFFVDGFITEGLKHSPYTLQGIQNFGLMVPVSPAHIRVHTPDFGVEAFDVIETLNPVSMKDLKINYLFLTKSQLNIIPQQRINDLKNKDYFEEVYANQEGKVYKVLPGYYERGENLSGGVSDLSDLIETGKSVYIDYPPRLDGALRAALFLLLKDKANIFSEWKSGAFNYIETRIRINPPGKDDKYDFLLLEPLTDPMSVCKCKNIIILWQTSGVNLYKVQN